MQFLNKKFFSVVLIFGVLFGCGFFVFGVEGVKAATSCNCSDTCYPDLSEAACAAKGEGCFFGDGMPCSVFCFCYDDPAKIDIMNYKTAEKVFMSTGESHCVDAGKVPVCSPEKILRGGGKKYDSCDPSLLDKALPKFLPNASTCKDAFTIWQSKKTAKLQGGLESEKTTQVGAGMGAFLPPCINTDKGCRDVGVFVEMGINLSSYLFGIIGALALLMFIYGGITLAISMGNPEKVKKGGEIILTALLGLAIVFGAYVLVKFMGEALVSSDFVLK